MVSLLAFVWASVAMLASSEAMVCELEEPRNMSILQEPSAESSQLSTADSVLAVPPKGRQQLRRAPVDAGATCQGIFDEECDMGLPDGEPRPSSSLSFDDRPPCLPVSKQLPLGGSATITCTFASHGGIRPGYPLELFRPPPLR